MEKGMHLPRKSRLIPVIVASILFVACGGSSNRVSAKSYATDVCTAAKTWIDDLQREGQTVAKAASGSPETGRQALTAMLDQVVASTDTFISKTRAAGVPDVKDGDQVAAQAVAALQQVKADMQKLRGEAAKLPTGSAAEFVT